jgi:hypothetical protein
MTFIRKITDTLTAYYSLQRQAWEVSERVQHGNGFYNPVIAVIELPETATNGQLMQTFNQQAKP